MEQLRQWLCGVPQPPPVTPATADPKIQEIRSRQHEYNGRLQKLQLQRELMERRRAHEDRP
jgi:hypothetical protein